MDEVTHKKNYKPIVLKDLFRDKKPAVARWIPEFVFRLLSRMLRIDFFNDPILYNHGYKKDVEFARASIEAFNVRNMDGIFVPINKHCAQAVENVRRINAIFESDEQVMSFPAGLVSRRRRGVIRDGEWQKSIITKVRQSKRDIVPIHVSGRISNFFYNLARIRKFLRIKTNLEMFFLPNESYKHRNKHFIITFGKPILFETFDKQFSPQEWAQHVKEHTYTIAEDPQSEFRFLKK